MLTKTPGDNTVWQLAKEKTAAEKEQEKGPRLPPLPSYAEATKELLHLNLPIAKGRNPALPLPTYEPTAEQKLGFNVPFSRIPNTVR